MKSSHWEYIIGTITGGMMVFMAPNAHRHVPSAMSRCDPPIAMVDALAFAPFVANLVPSNKARSPSSVLVATSKAPVTTSVALVTSSFLFLVVRPGAPSSVLAPSSDALCS